LLSGAGAALCLTATPLFRSRQAMLFAQLAAGACFATHYAGLGLAVAAGVNLLGLVQTAAALCQTRRAATMRLGYALIVLMDIVCLCFWQGPISALSLFAMTFVALARMQTEVLRLRLLLLAGGATWMAHDFVAQAWIALAADICAVVIGIAALTILRIRIRLDWRSLTVGPQVPSH
jgi:hypothetical protein